LHELQFCEGRRKALSGPPGEEIMKSMIGTIAKSDKGENRYSVRATTDDIDRQGERVIPSGITNLDHFIKTGSILYAHDWNAFPIGKPLSGKATDKELLIDIAFADTDAGREARQLYDGGFLSSFSIGFLPDYEKIDVIDNVRTYKSWELLELSSVPVPANASATIIREAESRCGHPFPIFAKMLSLSQDRVHATPSPTGEQGKSEPSVESPMIGVAEKYTQKGRSRLWTN